MKTITCSELKSRMDNQEELNLLDVREPDEHAAFNAGGKLLPLGQILATQVEDIEDWKNKEVICYCRSGKRSLQASMMLETLGFTNVKNLEGGMMAWAELQGKTL